MFISMNRTVFDIPLTWDRTRFEASRNKRRQARKLIEISINAQFNKQLKDIFFQKLDIEKTIIESQERLLNHEKKDHIFDKLTEIASQSLINYFDKRMENVRNAIQDHCNAIQQILHQENEHWKEIHNAIEQNLITSNDIHPSNNINQQISSPNIHTIDEVDEEEHISKLLDKKTITSLSTQMIHNSQLPSNHISTIESNTRLSTENLIQNKEERFSVILPLTSVRRTLRVIDTTFVVKIEESKTSETNISYQKEINPIESLPINEADAIQSYSQPKPPARLYFSPTLLQDDEESELIQPVLSTIDQNQIDIEKPKIIPRRFGQTFLLDNIKTEDINKTQDTENLRPKISNDISYVNNPNSSLSIEKQPLDESHHLEIPTQQKSVVYSKRRTRAAPKTESEPIHMTRRATRKQKQTIEIDTNKGKTRKRKSSISDDGNNNTIALRKKKTVPPPAAKPNTRKTRGKKTKEIPIREPSPLPIIDRSTHYRTHFSTRSNRLNNLTLSTTSMVDDDDENNNTNKSKYSSTRLRTKSMGRILNHDNDDEDNQHILPTRSNANKNQSKKRAKTTTVTKNRRKQKK